MLTVSKPTLDDFREFYIQRYPESINENWEYRRTENNALWSEYEAKLNDANKREVYRGLLGSFTRLEVKDE